MYHAWKARYDREVWQWGPISDMPVKAINNHHTGQEPYTVTVFSAGFIVCLVSMFKQPQLGNISC